MTLRECERKAQQEGFDSARFELVHNGRIRKVGWLDAYLGMMIFEELPKGFVTIDTAETMFPGAVCQNFYISPNPQGET